MDNQATLPALLDHPALMPAADLPPPKAKPKPRRRRCRLELTIDEVRFRVRVEVLPRDGLPPLHVVELRGRDAGNFRTFYGRDLDLIHCPCPSWSEEGGCDHADAAYAAGLYPEIDLAMLPAGVAP